MNELQAEQLTKLQLKECFQQFSINDMVTENYYDNLSYINKTVEPTLHLLRSN